MRDELILTGVKLSVNIHSFTFRTNRITFTTDFTFNTISTEIHCADDGAMVDDFKPRKQNTLFQKSHIYISLKVG